MNPNIKELLLDTGSLEPSSDGESILELATALPRLENLTIKYKLCSVDEIISFIENCEALKVVNLAKRFFSVKKEAIQLLTERLSVNWNIDISNGITLEVHVTSTAR